MSIDNSSASHNNSLINARYQSKFNNRYGNHLRNSSLVVDVSGVPGSKKF